MTLEDFNKLYRYRSDPAGIDQWLIPRVDDDGLLQDDCDGFSLGVIYYVLAEESLFKFWELLATRAKIHYVDNNGGHAVLQFDGKYIDNWTQEWVTKEHMESLGHKFHKRDYMFYQVALKMLNTKIRGIF